MRSQVNIDDDAIIEGLACLPSLTTKILYQTQNLTKEPQQLCAAHANVIRPDHTVITVPCNLGGPLCILQTKHGSGKYCNLPNRNWKSKSIKWSKTPSLKVSRYLMSLGRIYKDTCELVSLRNGISPRRMLRFVVSVSI